MLTNLYIQRQSVIHSLNFWTKFLGFSLVLPLLAFIAPPRILLVLLGFLFIILFLGKISFRKFWSLIKLYAISLTIGVIILSVLFSTPLEGLVLALRFNLLIAFGILFAAVTNPIEIPSGFLQTRIPHKYGVTLMVGYRLMPLLSQKIQTIIDAQRTRGARVSPAFFTNLAIPVLHSTLETSVRLSDALISRGYDPNGRITLLPSKFGRQDALFFLALALILVLGVV
jgi:energy-coupling factor transporter transmembrane protein EcfT